MKIRNLLFFAALSLTFALNSCKKEPIEPDPIPPVLGCTDMNSLNFNPSATQDDGSCNYATNFFPMTVGNMWHLEDEINLQFFSATVEIDFEIVGDTLLKQGPYIMSREQFGSPDFNQGSRDDLFGYRRTAAGKLYRLDLKNADAEEILFLDYPLEVGHTWYDNEAEDHYLCEVLSHGPVTVPAGAFNDVVEVKYTDLSNAQEFTVFFAKDIGVIKSNVSINMVVAVDIEAELTAYTVN